MNSIVLLLLNISILGASTVYITLPKVPDVPKVTVTVPSVSLKYRGNYPSNEEILKRSTQEKVIHFSNHVAPVEKIIQDDTKVIKKVGDIVNGKVTAYLHGPLETTQEVVDKLTNAGFKVLKTFEVDKKALATAIIFTNKALIKLGSKQEKGFASILRITIDKKNKLISVSNPVFVLHAFMGEQYDEKIANELLVSIRKAFPQLYNSKEVLKVRLLKRYQFMKGMPKYKDMLVIAKEPTQTLLEKVKANKNVVFTQKLLSGSTLIGVRLSKRTSRFIKKVGYQNAGLLPYPVLIENGEAKILDPKFYIAIMYPLLKMSQFMTIATVPGAINKDIDRIFR